MAALVSRSDAVAKKGHLYPIVCGFLRDAEISDTKEQENLDNAGSF
jgi:hypothetical protein